MHVQLPSQTSKYVHEHISQSSLRRISKLLGFEINVNPLPMQLTITKKYSWTVDTRYRAINLSLALVQLSRPDAAWQNPQQSVNYAPSPRDKAAQKLSSKLSGIGLYRKPRLGPTYNNSNSPPNP